MPLRNQLPFLDSSVGKLCQYCIPVQSSVWSRPPPFDAELKIDDDGDVVFAWVRVFNTNEGSSFTLRDKPIAFLDSSVGKLRQYCIPVQSSAWSRPPPFGAELKLDDDGDVVFAGVRVFSPNDGASFTLRDKIRRGTTQNKGHPLI